MCRHCYQAWLKATRHDKASRPPLESMKVDRWAKYHSACKNCNGADSPHHGRGICNRCFLYMRRHGLLPKRKAIRFDSVPSKLPMVSPIGDVYIGTRIVLQAAFGALVCGSVVRSESRYLRIKDDATRNVLEINPKAILAKGDSGKVTICNLSAWGELGSQARRWATNKLHEVAA
jgi:hypothetical protein